MGRELFGLRGIFCKFYAAGFAATTHKHLGFNNNAATQFFGNCLCLVCGGRHTSLRDRYTISGKDLFGLIFVEFHAMSLVLE